jgi:hypothetical protein
MWQDGRDTGANIIAAHDRGVADSDTRNVGNGIQRTRRQNADDDALFAGAWPFDILRNRSHDGQKDQKSRFHALSLYKNRLACAFALEDSFTLGE